MQRISQYKYLIFDCDGVILNSNNIKTEAFGEVVASFGDKASKSLIDFHLERGGISRYEKFKYFVEVIALKLNLNLKHISLDELINRYSSIVKKKLEKCEINTDIINYKKISKAKWFIVSGSDQKELREIFSKRKICEIFDGGIYGSPLNKEDIFSNLLQKNKINKTECLYIGDSEYDHISSAKFELDFIFLKKWSEFKNIDNYAFEKKINLIDEFNQLL
jgi:phosphoglycolate phosphatase-like HAD superfamily hydrolase